MRLTPKQESFCQAYVRCGNKSQAYRDSYNTGRMKSETINRNAHELLKSNKIATRVVELQKAIEEKGLYTLEKSVEKDVALIELYETCLEVLQSDKSKSGDIEVAERTIRYIGAGGYSAAQDRLAKKQGWFQKDNSQKNQPLFNVVDARKKG